jgi:hypothetical protein
VNKAEAQEILSEQLARFSGRSHSELAQLVETHLVETCEVRGGSGTMYQIEIQFFWDDRPDDAIRVIGGIDDRGTRPFFPLTDSLLITRPKSLSA